jgi:hypothetical protein
MKFVKLTVIATIIMVSMSLQGSEVLDQDVLNNVADKIRSLVETNPRHPMNESEHSDELAREILRAANSTENVEPELILTMAFCESTLRTTARGGLGEVGIMQIHGVAKRGCDMETRQGQLNCGAKFLQESYNICGSWEGSLTRYATGKCKSDKSRVKWLVNYRIKMWEKLKKREEID